MYIINNMGPIGLCLVEIEIPLITSVHSEKKPFSLTLCFLKHEKDLIHLRLGSTLYNFTFFVEADVGPYQMLFRNLYKWHLSALLFPNFICTHPLYATVEEQLIVPLR